MQLSPSIYKRLVRPDWFYNKFIKRIIEQNFNLDNKRVLDFGCGVGTCSRLFSPLLYVGLDCDKSRIDYAKKAYPNSEFICMKNNEIDVDKKSIDCILISSVLHHIDNEHIGIYLEQFRDILTDEGFIIVIEPYFNEEGSFSNWLMKVFDRGEHIREAKEYLGLFKELGYKANVLNKYRQCLIYNKMLFIAYPNQI